MVQQSALSTLAERQRQRRRSTLALLEPHANKENELDRSARSDAKQPDQARQRAQSRQVAPSLSVTGVPVKALQPTVTVQGNNAAGPAQRQALQQQAGGGSSLTLATAPKHPLPSSVQPAATATSPATSATQGADARKGVWVMLPTQWVATTAAVGWSRTQPALSPVQPHQPALGVHHPSSAAQPNQTAVVPAPKSASAAPDAPWQTQQSRGSRDQIQPATPPPVPNLGHTHAQPHVPSAAAQPQAHARAHVGPEAGHQPSQTVTQPSQLVASHSNQGLPHSNQVAVPQSNQSATQSSQAVAPSSAAPHAQGSQSSVCVDPEEWRRRARRRHRKRLAALVVEHWKWFARDALKGVRADRHYRHQLLGAALVGLQANVVTAHAHTRLAAVQLARRRHFLLVRVLDEWRGVAQSRARLRRLGSELAARHAQAVRRGVLRVWCQWRWQRLRKDRQELQADQWYAQRTLSHALHAWRTFLRYKQCARHGHRLAVLHWTRHCMGRAMTAWRDVCAWRQHKRRQEDVAVSWQRYQLLTQSLTAWRVTAQHQVSCRAQAVACLTACRDRWCKQLMADVLTQWRALRQRRLHLQSLQTQLQHTLLTRRLRCILYAWLAWAVRQRELRLAAGALAPLGPVWRVCVYWERWREATERGMALRGAELRTGVVMRATLRTLASYVQHRQRKRELQSAWNAAVRRMWLRACLKGWREQARRLRCKALCWQAAGDAYSAHLCVYSMQGWVWYVAHVRHKRQKWARAVAYNRQRTLAKAMRAWVLFYRRRTLKKDVVTWARRGLASAALHAWREYTAECKAETARWTAAVQQRRRSLLLCAWAGLRASVERRAAKRWLWARSVEHHQHSLMLRALLAWAHLYIPMAAEVRARAARAAGHWRRRVLQRAFAGWQIESARLAVKRGKYQEADAFARELLMRRALAAWQEGVALRQEKRRYRGRQLAYAQEVLRCKKLTRLFTAWYDYHIGRVLKGLQTLRATAHFTRVRQSAVLFAWRQWLHTAQLRHMSDARARHHHTLCCIRTAWSAWCEYVAYRHERSEAKTLADTHAARGRMQRSLHALSWYVAYRHRKAADMQGALALHTQLLQREGAAQWLRVGLWRRTHRLQHIATNQARQLASQLALVEPYARHWRRVTQSRQRARLTHLHSQLLTRNTHTVRVAPPPTTNDPTVTNDPCAETQALSPASEALAAMRVPFLLHAAPLPPYRAVSVGVGTMGVVAGGRVVFRNLEALPRGSDVMGRHKGVSVGGVAGATPLGHHTRATEQRSIAQSGAARSPQGSAPVSPVQAQQVHAPVSLTQATGTIHSTQQAGLSSSHHTQLSPPPDHNARRTPHAPQASSAQAAAVAGQVSVPASGTSSRVPHTQQAVGVVSGSVHSEALRLVSVRKERPAPRMPAFLRP